MVFNYKNPLILEDVPTFDDKNSTGGSSLRTLNIDRQGRVVGIPFGSESTAPIIKTKTEIDVLILSNALLIGSVYKITGVHPNLYNDGTNSGTTIYLQALTNNTLAKEGYGEFWNPKYNQAIAGFGIWNENMDNPVIGSKVIWGGYSWTNNTGEVGYDEDVLNINVVDWTKDIYNYTDYRKVIDVIEYDLTHDYIIRRKEVEGGNDVTFTYYDNLALTPIVSSIALFQFGNIADLPDLHGVSSNIIQNSVFECINFCGGLLANNNVSGRSNFYSNTFDPVYIEFKDNTLVDCTMYNNRFRGATSSFINNNIKNSNVTSNTFTNSSVIATILESESYINGCNINNNSSISYVDLRQASRIDRLNTNNTQISYISLCQLSVIQTTTINGSSITDVEFISSALVLQPYTLTAKTIAHLRLENVLVSNINLQAATVLFDTTLTKTLYKRPDDVYRIRYYNNSDQLTIVPITT